MTTEWKVDKKYVLEGLDRTEENIVKCVFAGQVVVVEDNKGTQWTPFTNNYYVQYDPPKRGELWVVFYQYHSEDRDVFEQTFDSEDEAEGFIKYETDSDKNFKVLATKKVSWKEGDAE